MTHHMWIIYSTSQSTMQIHSTFTLAFLALSCYIVAALGLNESNLKAFQRRANITDIEVLEAIAEARTCDDCQVGDLQYIVEFLDSDTDAPQNVMVILQEVANEGDEAFVEVATEWCIAFGVGYTFPRIEITLAE
jgi:hypothetical protein